MEHTDLEGAEIEDQRHVDTVVERLSIFRHHFPDGREMYLHLATITGGGIEILLIPYRNDTVFIAGVKAHALHVLRVRVVFDLGAAIRVRFQGEHEVDVPGCFNLLEIAEIDRHPVGDFHAFSLGLGVGGKTHQQNQHRDAGDQGMNSIGSKHYDAPCVGMWEILHTAHHSLCGDVHALRQG